MNLPELQPIDPLVPLLRQVGRYLAEDHHEAANLLSEKILARLKQPKSKAPPTIALLHYLLNNRIELAPALLWSESQFDPRPESTQRIWRAFNNHNFVLLQGSGSMSKCLAPDTLVRTFDHQVIRADQVKLGDKLMGPDGNPRQVLEVHQGTDEMFTITPVASEPFTVTKDHILRVRFTDPDRQWFENISVDQIRQQAQSWSVHPILMELQLVCSASQSTQAVWTRLVQPNKRGDRVVLPACCGDIAQQMGCLVSPAGQNILCQSGQLLQGGAFTRFKIEPAGHGPYSGFGVDQDNLYLLGSGVVTHNSFSMAIRLFLEWLRDPRWTSVKLVGPTAEHLESNLFTHIVRLHRESSVELPGQITQRFIGLDPKERKAAILGTIIPAGHAGGKLRGSKPEPRDTPHPVHGPLSRQYIFIDEMNLVPAGIWTEIDNLMSTKQGDCLKIIGAYNPTGSPEDLVGQAAEPLKGWGFFDPEADFEWMSKRGWYVVRLDAQQCENVVHGRTIFPGLQTREGFDQISLNAGGINTAAYWTMARGCFNQKGSTSSIIPAGSILVRKGVPTWLEPPVRVCGGDLALEGDDMAVMTTGLWGRVSHITRTDGTVHKFLSTKGRPEPRQILWVESITKLPRAETIERANQITEMIVRNKIAPNHLMLDRSGNGQGVYDLLRAQRPGVRAVSYGETATDRKICEEDTQKCCDVYNRVYSELHFATKLWIQNEVLWFNPELPSGYEVQLEDRREAPGKKLTVEPKKVFKLRHRHSPDEGDSITLTVHAVRVGLGVVIKQLGDRKAPTPTRQPEHQPGYVSADNRQSFIDDE